MKVRILDEVVPPPGGSSAQLDLLLAAGELGQLRVVAEAPDRFGVSVKLQAWLGDRVKRYRPVFQRGMTPMSGLAGRDVDLISTESNFEAAVIQHNITEVRWLLLPIRVYVENSRADYGFFKKSVPSDWRSRVNQAIASVEVEPAVGGGLPELLEVAKAHHSADTRLRRRSWFLFDSDAARPGEPAKKATELRDLLQQLRVPFHMLSRRAIENYVPPAARRAWVHQSSERVPARQDWMNAFNALPATERHHLNMKKGDPTRSDPLASGCPHGRNDRPLSDVWSDDAWQVTEKDLDADDSRNERIRMVQSLMRLVI